MAKQRSSQVIRHTLIVRDADGEVINGTCTPAMIDGARRLAYSILQLLPGSATVDVYAYDAGKPYGELQPLATVTLDDENGGEA